MRTFFRKVIEKPFGFRDIVFAQLNCSAGNFQNIYKSSVIITELLYLRFRDVGDAIPYGGAFWHTYYLFTIH